jgi:hypothetical protein
MVEYSTMWFQKGLIAGAFIDADHLASAIDSLLRSGPSLSIPSITIAPLPTS